MQYTVYNQDSIEFNLLVVHVTGYELRAYKFGKK